MADFNQDYELDCGDGICYPKVNYDLYNLLGVDQWCGLSFGYCGQGKSYNSLTATVEHNLKTIYACETNEQAIEAFEAHVAKGHKAMLKTSIGFQLLKQQGLTARITETHNVFDNGQTEKSMIISQLRDELNMGKVKSESTYKQLSESTTKIINPEFDNDLKGAEDYVIKHTVSFKEAIFKLSNKSNIILTNMYSGLDDAVIKSGADWKTLWIEKHKPKSNILPDEGYVLFTTTARVEGWLSGGSVFPRKPSIAVKDRAEFWKSNYLLVYDDINYSKISNAKPATSEQYNWMKDDNDSGIKWNTTVYKKARYVERPNSYNLKHLLSPYAVVSLFTTVEEVCKRTLMREFPDMLLMNYIVHDAPIINNSRASLIATELIGSAFKAIRYPVVQEYEKRTGIKLQQIGDAGGDTAISNLSIKGLNNLKETSTVLWLTNPHPDELALRLVDAKFSDDPITASEISDEIVVDRRRQGSGRNTIWRANGAEVFIFTLPKYFELIQNTSEMTFKREVDRLSIMGDITSDIDMDESANLFIFMNLIRDAGYFAPDWMKDYIDDPILNETQKEALINWTSSGSVAVRKLAVINGVKNAVREGGDLVRIIEPVRFSVLSDDDIRQIKTDLQIENMTPKVMEYLKGGKTNRDVLRKFSLHKLIPDDELRKKQLKKWRNSHNRSARKRSAK